MIAVTGAAGFIGTNLARRLAEVVDRPLVLVDHPPSEAKSTNVAAVPGSRFMGHLEFADALASGGLVVEAIFHLGACSDTTEADWDYLRRNNVEYSCKLWRWCAHARGSALHPHLQHAATYGDGSLGFDDRTHPDRLRPLNLYGKSKNDFDAWVMEMLGAGGPVPGGWAGLKFFNVYGPHEGHKGRMASMAWHGYHQAVERGEVALFKSTEPGMPDGGQRRDFVFVDDCIDHMLWLWRHPEASGIYNSGSGEARSFRELAEAIFAAMGRAPRIRYIEMPEDLRGRYQSFTQATTSKLREAGYPGRPTSLEEGVARYVAWIGSRS